MNFILTVIFIIVIVKLLLNHFEKMNNEVDEENINAKNEEKINESNINVDKDKNIITSTNEVNPIKEEPKQEIINYSLPKISILKYYKYSNIEDEILEQKIKIKEILEAFKVNADIINIYIGPRIILYELKLSLKTKVNEVTSLNKEIALHLAVRSVNIHQIENKDTIGIEVPKRKFEPIGLRNSLEYSYNNFSIPIGADINGSGIYKELKKLKHILISGSTGSGKSMFIHACIIHILMTYKPSEVRLVLIDTKKIELSSYNGIPHLLCPVINNPKKASLTLNRVINEMDKRFQKFSDNNVKNIEDYNRLNKEEMPYIVVIIDELNELMLVDKENTESSIKLLTEMASNAGIYLIVATARPSIEIVTGLVKSSFPTKIAFSVASASDSRIILNQSGAEKLLGKGDMLYLESKESKVKRLQGYFISDDEITRVVEYWKSQGISDSDYLETPSETQNTFDDDEAYNEVVEFAIQTGKISTSLIQRRFRFGYTRAARMMDLLESRGVVGPQNGAKPREVLVKLEREDNE